MSCRWVALTLFVVCLVGTGWLAAQDQRPAKKERGQQRASSQAENSDQPDEEQGPARRRNRDTNRNNRRANQQQAIVKLLEELRGELHALRSEVKDLRAEVATLRKSGEAAIGQGPTARQVADQVLSRARKQAQLQHLRAELQQAMQEVAKSEVLLVKMQDAREALTASIKKQHDSIAELAAALKSGKPVLKFGGKNYRAEEVRRDLEKRQTKLLTQQTELQRLTELHDVRAQVLANGKQRLNQLQKARHELEVEVERLKDSDGKDGKRLQDTSKKKPKN